MARSRAPATNHRANGDASRQSPTLAYESSLVTTRYEHGLETERATLLRRRFLWYTGTILGVSILFSPFSVMSLMMSDGLGRLAEVLNIINSVVSFTAFAIAFWYVRRRVRAERLVYHIAFWLIVGSGLLSLVTGRAVGELTVRNPGGSASFQAGFEQGAAIGGSVRRTADDDDSPTTQPATATDAPAGGEQATTEPDPAEPVASVPDPPGAIAAEDAVASAPAPLVPQGTTASRVLRSILSIVIVSGSLLITHLLACLFLPWTPREAWRPGRVLLAGAFAIVVVDLMLGWGGIGYLLGAIVFYPLTILPGIGWCWWRHSAFREKYRLHFVSEQYRQMEQELSGARRVHDSVLPKPRTLGQIRFGYAYEPAREIGGDLVFVHPRKPNPTNPDEPVSVVVLDVAGHGIAAALTVNRLVGELERIFAEQPDVPPDRLMRLLNRYAFLTLARHRAFVTGFAVRVDLSLDKPLQVCGAGHPDAFLCHADDRETSRVGSRAMMLGVLPPDAYEAPLESHAFDDGDALVLYTDGAAEARNIDGDMLRMDGVSEIAASAVREEQEVDRWPHAMLHRVALYRNGPPEDDTLVAVLYRDATSRFDQLASPTTMSDGLVAELV